MNWNKLKTFLIVLFSVLNIILIITMLTKDYKEAVVPQITIQDTVEILEKRGISVDKEIIPDRAKNMEAFSMQTLNFAGVPYKVSYPGGEIFEISIPEKAGSIKDIKKLMSGLGIQYAEIQGDGKDTANIRAIQVIDSFTIFSNYIDVKSGDNGITIRGRWLTPSNDPLDNDDTIEPSQVTSVLIEFISNPDRPQGNIKISRIQFGYYAPGYTLTENVQSFTVVPCWEISLDSGERFYYDARNGEYLK